MNGVYDMLALRARVFVLEQGPYLDPDGADRQAWHLLGRDAGHALSAYLRTIPENEWELDTGIVHYRKAPATVARCVDSLIRDYRKHRLEILVVFPAE